MAVLLLTHQNSIGHILMSAAASYQDRCVGIDLSRYSSCKANQEAKFWRVSQACDVFLRCFPTSCNLYLLSPLDHNGSRICKMK